MNKILNASKGKPCSCPDHKTCTACYAKKKLKPRIHVQQPRNPSVPIRVERFTQRNGRIIKIKDSLSDFVSHRKKHPATRQWSCDNVRNWYRRRRDAREQKLREEKDRRSLERDKREFEKAQRRFEKEQLEEQKRIEREQYKIQLENAKIEERARLQREKEVLEQIKEQEKYLRSYNRQQQVETATTYKDRKKQDISNDKKVYVKNYNHHESWKTRFSHWFYRACCRFYCYLTSVIVLFIVIIFVI